MYPLDDNIVALATSPKDSAINLVRCSGPSISNVFMRLTKQEKSPPANTINLFLIMCPTTNKVIDHSLVSVFKKPKSYTGEDMIEISTHGGVIICKKIINAMLNLGCRIANPGEFTYRAFINEKIDLIQAESINTLIKTENNIENSLSLSNLSGVLSKKIKNIEKKLINIITVLEHHLDFNDDEISKEEINTHVASIKKISNELSSIIKNSLLVGEKNTQTSLCLAGKPNVGKSSLFNLLVGHDRAIVNRVAGTTRDTITTTHLIKDTEIELVDTAGIRKTNNQIEKAGIARSIKAIKESSLVLFVDDKNPEHEWAKLKINKDNIVFIQNKIDIKELQKKKNVFHVSCKTKTGIDRLLTHLLTLFKDNMVKSGGLVLLNLRQVGALEDCNKKTKSALQNYNQSKDLSVFLTSLYSSLDSLGRLRGSKKDINIINNIFSGFCVGK